MEISLEMQNKIRLHKKIKDQAEEIERLRGALRANIVAAELIADDYDIDTSETFIRLKIMPKNEVVEQRSWQSIIDNGYAALKEKE